MIVDLINIALMFVGTPYVWGGNDLTTGVDCSGFVCEVTRSAGLIGKQDMTAQGLYKFFRNQGLGSGIQRNSILFFGKDLETITHVAIAIDNKYMVEAGGEGRVATDKGYVRVRPITIRKDLVAALKVKL